MKDGRSENLAEIKSKHRKNRKSALFLFPLAAQIAFVV